MRLEPENRRQRVLRWVKSSILRIDRIPLFGSAIFLYLLWLTLWTNQVSLLTTVSQLVLTVGFVLWIFYDIRKKWDWSLWLLLMVAVLAIGILFSWANWEFLHGKEESPASPTIRNLGLLIGGALAAILAVWRSIVAERQADTAQQSLLNERYQKGAEMLGNEVLAVRLGGIYALERLAAEHPEQYHIQVMKLFCAFARHPAEDSMPESETDSTEPSTDVQAVMDAIGARSESRIRLEKLENYRPDLRRVLLRRASLWMANLSNMRLSRARLQGAALGQANLSEAILNQADLSGATLGGGKAGWCVSS